MTETIKGSNLSSSEKDQIIFWRNVLKNESIHALKAILAEDDLPAPGKKQAAEELLAEQQTKERDFTIVVDDEFAAKAESIINEKEYQYLPNEEINEK